MRFPRPLEPHSVQGRLLVLGAVLAVATVVAVVVGLPEPERLRAEIAATGPAGPAVFVVLYAAATLAPVPKNVLSAAAGLLFGLLEGVLLVWLAALAGALIAFALGRSLGREAVERLTGARMARVDALLTRRGLPAVLGARLVPVLPYTAVNYGAGLTAVRPGDYVVGTALGIVPGTVAYVSLGAYGTSPGSWPFVAAVVALVVLAAGGAVAGRRAARRTRPRGYCPGRYPAAARACCNAPASRRGP